MNESCRKVVVTGMGAVTPFGVGVAPLWNGVSSGRSGIDWIRSLGDLDPEHYPVRYAGEVRDFDVDKLLAKHCEVRLEKSVQMALVAAQQALAQARLLDDSASIRSDANPVAVLAGSGHGPCHELEVPYEAYFTRGPRAVRPTTIPKAMFNSLSSQLSIHFGLTGANHVIASACTSGTAAIGLGTLFIRQRLADIVLCGGADAPLTPFTFTCWTNMRVLARHSEPQRASRPFDAKRNGLVVGEGAAMVVLESQESAERRGVMPLARVLGYGTSSDAHHITSPTVAGQVAAMRNCLADARIKPEQVDYINLHGTATKANDETEATAVAEVFGRRGNDMPSSSTKSMLGHSLGASGAIEFAICVEAMRQGFVPPTINCDEPDPDIGLDYVPLTGRKHLVRIAMSNSFAFGGNNACILLGKDE
ncbi:MAG TPA: beta-ketoacyl-[acyl-carrier-protein] synthase family protein [Planctomycetaceae bacterium]|jgi:3-oxoacyl-[acyl-carrier-protein] synthase II|nr:beta-ketoacyl-[acyl-carrier-protein] synthase family protein [Planctomycetaceae bacterium]